MWSSHTLGSSAPDVPLRAARSAAGLRLQAAEVILSGSPIPHRLVVSSGDDRDATAMRRLGPALHVASDALAGRAAIREVIRVATGELGVRSLVVLASTRAEAPPAQAEPSADAYARLRAGAARASQAATEARARLRADVRALHDADDLVPGGGGRIVCFGVLHVVESGVMVLYAAEHDAFTVPAVGVDA